MSTCLGQTRGTLTDRLRQIEAAILEYRPSPEVAERAARLDAMGRDGHRTVVSDFSGLLQSYADYANEADPTRCAAVRDALRRRAL